MWIIPHCTKMNKKSILWPNFLKHFCNKTENHTKIIKQFRYLPTIVFPRMVSTLNFFLKETNYNCCWNLSSKCAYSLMCWSCHFDRASNDEFSVEFWMCFLTSKVGMTVVKIDLIREPYSKEKILIPWRCPKL